MKIWKLAAVAALGAFTVVSANAAPMSGLGDLDTPTSIEDAKAKRAAKGPRAAPGKCGVMKYYVRKTRSCASKG